MARLALIIVQAMIHVTIHLRDEDSALRLAARMREEELLTRMHITSAGSTVVAQGAAPASGAHYELHGLTKALLFYDVERKAAECENASLLHVESTPIHALDPLTQAAVLAETRKV